MRTRRSPGNQDRLWRYLAGPMLPSTIERRAALRKQKTAERTAGLRDRLAARAAEAGPDSIWAEMLAEMER